MASAAPYPVSIYPVQVCELVVFVAFDPITARVFRDTENDEYQCNIAEIDELVLVDNYGFPCQIKDTGFLFPWLADVTPEIVNHFLTAPNVMTPREFDAAIFAEDYAAHLAENAAFIEAEERHARMMREL